MLKRFFLGWTVFEIIFLIASVVLPVTVGVVSGSGLLEICTSVLSLIVAIFTAKAKIEGYVLCLVSAVLYAIVSYKVQLYGETIICAVINIPVVIYGIINWARNQRKDNSKGNVVTIGWTGATEVICVVLSQIIMGVGYYFMLKAFNTENLLLSTISICTSVLAGYLVARRSQLGLFGYAVNDIVVITLWALITANGSPNSAVMLVMPCMYLINDIYGTIEWRRLKKGQKTQAIL
jgi:nicotinamide mononucleotide transporter PnuC